jgi:hypothetical protein
LDLLLFGGVEDFVPELSITGNDVFPAKLFNELNKVKVFQPKTKKPNIDAIIIEDTTFVASG